ncbi:MAG: precorrin-4 C(11)-methyltransferase [Oscillibacter sp.]|nr:precorrin-4 C(11)-methyltransferase [Oscillibacter sp.]
MIHFIGAGPGAADLITVRGAELLRHADVVIYAGSLVNPALLENLKPRCEVRNSAFMTLEDVLSVMEAAHRAGKDVARLHSGDPCLYGAVREQMDALDARGVPWDVTPGVSSFCGAAAALGAEYTLPGVSQSVILTRMPGKTDAEHLRTIAASGVSLVLFLSGGMADAVQTELMQSGAYVPATPAAIVYKATWPDERIIRCTVGTLADAAKSAGIRKHALILVGDFLGASYERSRLYDPSFTTEYRKGAS